VIKLCSWIFLSALQINLAGSISDRSRPEGLFAMYAQFRSQYPMGSLISELLNIHEGKFIVKAIIQVGGSILATGLSAAPSIEQAEDQARARALVILGIDGQPYPTQAQIVNAEPDRPAVRNQARLSAPATEFLPLTEAPFRHSEEVDWAIAANSSRAMTHQESADRAARSFQGTEQQQLSWFGQDLEPETPRLSEQPRSQEIPPAQTPNPTRSSLLPQREGRSITDGENRERTATLAAPVDLSDIIAHTDIELKRLGWTNAQGRRYLEQTYGKRSRQHLSDTELAEFLDYLKTQPVPGKAAL
jgi:hypothetical protein